MAKAVTNTVCIAIISNAIMRRNFGHWNAIGAPIYMTDVPQGKRNSGRQAAIWLGIILLIGLYVRVYDVWDESYWWDEFTSIVHLNPPQDWQDSPDYNRWNQAVDRNTAPSLFAFWKANRSMDPATMPLYYTFEYLWNTYISHDYASLRIFTIAIGLSIIPAIFLFGRSLFGATAGLVAAFCVALSPVHRQFSQEIRMYGVMTLLALLSCYFFTLLLRDGRKRWWAAYAVVTLGLYWTHPFAVFVPFVQGLFWLCFHTRDFMRLTKWGLLNALLVAPTAIYVMTIRFWDQQSTSDWMRVPGFGEFLGDLIGDDCVSMTWQFAPYLGTWEPMQATWANLLPAGAAASAVSMAPAMGRLMMLFFIVLTVWLVVAVFLQKTAGAKGEQKPRDWRWVLFLLLWWVVPALTLYLLSLLWRPCIMPRYSVHSSLALYLMLGGAVAMLPRRWLRTTVIALIVAGYVYQMSLVFAGPRHPDYRGAAAKITAEGNDCDVILVHNWLWKRVFAFNMGPTPHVINYAVDYDTLAAEARWYLDQEQEVPGKAGETCGVWVVIRMEYFDASPSIPFENAAAAYNLRVERTAFGGLQRVMLYRVTRVPGSTSPNLELPRADAKEFADLALEFWRDGQYPLAIRAAERGIEVDPGFARAWSYLGMTYKEMGMRDEAIKAFTRSLELDPAGYPWDYTNLGNLLIEAGRYAESLKVLDMALGLLPNDSWTYTSRGRAYYEMGDKTAAITSLQKAIELDPLDARPQILLEEVRGE